VPANAQTTVSVLKPGLNTPQTPQGNTQQQVSDSKQSNMSQQQQQTNSNSMNKGVMAGFGDNNNGDN